MKLMLHMCCGPCTIYPLRVLREKGIALMGFFYRDNIHPYTECLKREEALEVFAKKEDVKVIYPKGYDLESFLRNIVFRESNRCQYCYYDRLEKTALMAKKSKSDSFSTTLLYSKFQQHEMIRSIGEAIGKSVGIPFYYEDFRIGWKEGVTTSKTLNMYRQQYCGCIFSEKERFYQSSSV